MNRRHFLGMLAAGAAGMVLDPEMLLWRPGAKTIFLPPAKPILTRAGAVQYSWNQGLLKAGDIVTINGCLEFNPKTGQYHSSRLQEFRIVEAVSSAELTIRPVITHAFSLPSDMKHWHRARLAHG
ncbi:MAG: twin-arginine translocation signal domain-containing protein [Acidobacteria bacterium]|nr:twin-arginine translocation signal domain-containing protein [Acidobacteriota bacterium]